MTNEQINRAVAEELGWEPYCHSNDYLWSLEDQNDNIVGRHSRGGIDADHCWRVCNLDFCNDHNAAAEMRKGITADERTSCTSWLLRVVVPDDRRPKYDFTPFDLINATPRQQSEAFLRMRGKWRE